VVFIADVPEVAPGLEMSLCNRILQVGKRTYCILFLAWATEDLIQ
jgi:hypothetical protein